MSKTVDLARLEDALPGYQFAFLITIGDDHRAHTTAVTPAYCAGVFEIGSIGRHSRANLAERCGVTLVFPSRDVGEYSLIVDGDTELTSDSADPVRIIPRRALLHRATDGPGYDCVVLSRP